MAVARTPWEVEGGGWFKVEQNLLWALLYFYSKAQVLSLPCLPLGLGCLR